MIVKVKTNSVEETQKLAQKLAQKLNGGEVIELIGDVGAGKTTFVVGLAEGLESRDHVSSPTFTICNVYKGRLTIQHCDFYRLHDDKLIQKELEDLIDDEGVVVLEWSENLVRKIDETVKIYIDYKSEEKRLITLELPRKYEYLAL